MILKDLLHNIENYAVHADLDTIIGGVSFDSRTIAPGELFVAISGYESDGYNYINEAVRRGAACVICEKTPETDTPHVLVANARRALAAVAAIWYGEPAKELKIIGVTGTNGKTTVTSLIKEILEQCAGAGTKVGLIGTNRNMIGGTELPAERTTPESLELQRLLRQMEDEGCRYVVMEVSSHALNLDRVFGIEFEVGVFTNLTPDHLDFHDSMESYARSKALLMQSSLRCAVNIDDEYAGLILQGAKSPAFRFSTRDDSAELLAKSIKLQEDKVDFCALTVGKLQRVELRIPGLFSVYNGLAAISAALLLGFSLEEASDALKTCGGVKGRVEVVPLNREFTVLIDYAHTPDALENVITTVRGFAKGRVVTLFGCGGDRDPKKRPMMGETAARLSDFVIVTSDNPRTEEPGAIIDAITAGMAGIKTPYRVIENRREAIIWALNNARKGDTLILAGKGHETYQIFGKDKTHFDEREVVAEFFRQNPR